MLASLFGIGGGVVAVPALTLFFGFPLKTAIGTSLLAMIPTALFAVGTELWIRPENLQLEMGLWLAGGAILGTFAGRWILQRLGESGLRWVYAFFLIFVAMRLLGIFSVSLFPSLSWSGTHSIAAASILGVGIFAGASSTLFGIGGGVIAVPLLLLLIQGISFHEARATSLLMIPAAAALGVWHHLKMGNVDRNAALQFGLPACAAAVGGVFLAQQISGRSLQSVFAFLLVIAAWRLLREGLNRRVTGA